MMGCLELKQTLQRVESEAGAADAMVSGQTDAVSGTNEDTARSGQMLQSKVAGSGQESVPETTDGASAQTTAAFAEPANSTPSYKVYIVVKERRFMESVLRSTIISESWKRSAVLIP